MVREGGEDRNELQYSDVRKVLSELVVRGLRNYFPGLNIFLESLCEAKYGFPLKELIASDIVEFCRLLDHHFSSRETTLRVLRLVLKPVLHGGEGERALDELLQGNPEPLLRRASEVLRRSEG